MYIAWVLACNCCGAKSIPSAGVCSIVVARSSLFFDLRLVSFGKRNFTSLRQRKIGPFVGMTYNFQPSCENRPIYANDVWFSAQLWGKSTHLWESIRHFRPVCWIGPFVGIGPVCKTGPVCESYIYMPLNAAITLQSCATFNSNKKKSILKEQHLLVRCLSFFSFYR